MRKLEIGPGEHPTEGYEHLDVRALPHIEYVVMPDQTQGGFVELPFGDDSLNEILAVHVLEHVGHRIIEKTLNEWRRVLKPGGILNVTVPDLKYLVKNLERAQRESEVAFRDGSVLAEESLRKEMDLTVYIFGGQAHSDDVHRFGYSEMCLRRKLTMSGFGDIKRLNDRPEYNELQLRVYK